MSGSVQSIAFDSPTAEREADRLGMWVFIASEALLFVALFLLYLITRLHHGAAFAAGSHALSFALGTANTAILLTSSFTIALAEQAGEADASSRSAVLLLALTALLGSVFLGIKFVEYHDEAARELVPFTGFSFVWRGADAEGARLFFSLYFMLTGLHALHMLAGLGVIAFTILRWRGADMARRRRRMQSAALYWHFVDVVWVFLYPLLYLLNR
jgi:cytochrome c oxidase subunit 3